jgi:hypothetical protein
MAYLYRVMRIQLKYVVVIVYFLLSGVASAADEAALTDKIIKLQKEVNELQLELTAVKVILKKLDDKSNVINQLKHETIIFDQDKLTLKSGSTFIELSKDGSINLKGKTFNIDTPKDQVIRGTKINDN